MIVLCDRGNAPPATPFDSSLYSNYMSKVRRLLSGETQDWMSRYYRWLTPWAALKVRNWFARAVWNSIVRSPETAQGRPPTTALHRPAALQTARRRPRPVACVRAIVQLTLALWSSMPKDAKGKVTSILEWHWLCDRLRCSLWGMEGRQPSQGPEPAYMDREAFFSGILRLAAMHCHTPEPWEYLHFVEGCHYVLGTDPGKLDFHDLWEDEAELEPGLPTLEPQRAQRGLPGPNAKTMTLQSRLKKSRSVPGEPLDNFMVQPLFANLSGSYDSSKHSRNHGPIRNPVPDPTLNLPVRGKASKHPLPQCKSLPVIPRHGLPPSLACLSPFTSGQRTSSSGTLHRDLMARPSHDDRGPRTNSPNSAKATLRRTTASPQRKFRPNPPSIWDTDPVGFPSEMSPDEDTVEPWSHDLEGTSPHGSDNHEIPRLGCDNTSLHDGNPSMLSCTSNPPAIPGSSSHPNLAGVLKTTQIEPSDPSSFALDPQFVGLSNHQPSIGSEGTLKRQLSRNGNVSGTIDGSVGAVARERPSQGVRARKVEARASDSPIKGINVLKYFKGRNGRQKVPNREKGKAYSLP